MPPLTKQELDDLASAMLERMEDELLPALTIANRTGELEGLLASLGMDDLLDRGDRDDADAAGRIIVIGQSMVPEDKLRSTARRRGFDPDRFEFRLEYERLKHFDFGKIRGSMGYAAILAGPIPHSTPGTAEASSFIARVERNPQDYPILIRLGRPGELKISNNSFKRGLIELETAWS